jgi:hypothetical protein
VESDGSFEETMLYNDSEFPREPWPAVTQFQGKIPQVSERDVTQMGQLLLACVAFRLNVGRLTEQM